VSFTVRNNSQVARSFQLSAGGDTHLLHDIQIAGDNPRTIAAGSTATVSVTYTASEHMFNYSAELYLIARDTDLVGNHNFNIVQGQTGSHSVSFTYQSSCGGDGGGTDPPGFEPM
jgi:hypothetical protein